MKNDLVCPRCQKKLMWRKGECINGHRFYPDFKGVVSFLNKVLHKKWDSYHSLIYPNLKPQKPMGFYTSLIDPSWKVVCDVGSGDGVMSVKKANQYQKLYCVDPSVSSLTLLLKRKLKNVYPINSVGELLPFKRNFFDGVFNIYVIEHLKNPEKMLKQIYRVLKPGGKLLISTDGGFYYKYLRHFFESIRQKKFIIFKDDPTHVNLMGPSKLRRYLHDAGFDIVKEELGLYGYTRLEKLLGKSLSEEILAPRITILACKR